MATSTAEERGPGRRATLRAPGRGPARLAAIAFATVAAIAFALTRPPVGDFWAAQARQSAAHHGVGLGYWFSWFGGTVPGHYSVLIPYLTQVVDVGVLGAAATILGTALTWLLLRGTRHPVAGTWIAAVAGSVSLWSGRVPFALGCVGMLVTLLCVRNRWPVAAGAAAVLATLVSPVAGAFLMLGVAGLLIHDAARRMSALVVAIAAGGCLITLFLLFGSPGPEGFTTVQAVLAEAAIALMLLLRPPAYLRTVILLALVICPVVAIVPNGLGSNFERLAWICLPVAAVATARIPLLRAVLAGVLAISVGIVASAHDLWVATQPMSRPAYSAGLVAELGRLPDLANLRVEVVPDGTHVVAYELLGRALEARGFETQSDNRLDAVLHSPSLSAASYRRWLDTNAVGYVALDRRTLKPGAEDRLVRHHRPGYLHLQWSDAHWMLWRVAAPTHVASAPAAVVSAHQAQITVETPRPGPLALRVRWSHFLGVRGADAADRQGGCARLAPRAGGWTTLTVCAPGRYLVSG